MNKIHKLLFKRIPNTLSIYIGFFILMLYTFLIPADIRMIQFQSILFTIIFIGYFLHFKVGLANIRKIHSIHVIIWSIISVYIIILSYWVVESAIDSLEKGQLFGGFFKNFFEVIFDSGCRGTANSIRR
jgi:hypothetical protein